MSLSSLSIRRPVFAWMLFAAALLFGGISFSRLGLSQLPDVDFPVLNVSFTLNGASPEVMENDILDVAEDALLSVEGVKEIRSTAQQGRASISLDFTLDKDINVAVQEVQAKLSQIARRLPLDMDPPSVSKTNPEDQPILWLAATGPEGGLTKALMLLVRDQIRDQFQTVPGVSEITLGGFVDRNLRVWVDGPKLAAYQLSVDDVINTVDREHLELPAGRIETASIEKNVRFLGEAPSVTAFGDLPITARGGAPVYRRLRVRDVARLEDGLDDIRRISRFNGKPAVGLGIRKQRGVNAVDVARAVKERMLKVRADLPKGYALDLSVDNTVFVEHAVHELQQTLVLAALLTGLVCWLFLGSWSSTANVLLSIPFSVIGAFAALYYFRFTMNTFTLLALSLAIGVVVDDAIKVLENIVRHKEMGKTRMQASVDGASEISFAAMAATFSIVAIFLPVAFMQGVIGRYFYQFGITISVAALLSLVEALTLTPMRTSLFLDERGHTGGRMVDRLFGRMVSMYASSLDRCLRHRWKVLAGALAIFALGMVLAGRLKKEMIPAQDQSMILLRLSLPTGTGLNTTDEVVKKAEAWLSTRGELERRYVAVGGFGGSEVNAAMMFLSLKPKSQRPIVAEALVKPGTAPPKAGTTPTGPPPPVVKRRLSQAEFAAVCRREISKLAPKLRVSAQDLSQRGFSTGRGFPVEFSVRGPEWPVLASASEKIRKALVESGKLVDVDSDYLEGQLEVRVVPDREAAARRGVSMSSLGNVIGNLLGGKLAGKFSEGGRRNDVRVRLEGDERSANSDILKLYVRNNRGELVRLSEVVRLSEGPSLQAIRRINRERAVTLFGNPAPGVSVEDALAEALRLSKENLPLGYHAVTTGASQEASNTNAQLVQALLLGIAVAYMILASQFNSFRDPLIVLLAMPLSFAGAFGALLMFGQSLNIYSFIGLILLMGLVKKNSILLVDVTNQFRGQGLDRDQALRQACPLRLRPIVMTSVATIAGALPAAASLGAGSETLRPMGLAVVGGMLLSTFLTLFVVPAAYSLFARSQPSQAPGSARKRLRK